MSPSILVLGAGNLGSGIASTLLAASLEVAVWNRNPSRAEPLRAAGARIESSLPEGIEASDIVVVCISGPDTVHRLLDEPAARAALQGRVLLQFTTGSAEQARETERWAAAAGVRYLAGAVCVYPRHLGSDESYVLYGGPDEVFQAASPVPAALGGKAVHLGDDVGLPALLDQTELVFFYGALVGFFQAAAMAEAEGMAVSRSLEHVLRGVPMVAEVLTSAAARIAESRYGEAESSVAIDISSLRGIVDTCERLGVDAELPALIERQYERAAVAGHAESDTSAIFEVFRSRKAGP